MLGTLTTRAALGSHVTWTPIFNKIARPWDVFGPYIREAETPEETVARELEIKKLELTVARLVHESLRGKLQYVGNRDNLDALLAALEDGVAYLEKELEKLEEPREQYAVAILHDQAEMGYEGHLKCCPTAIAVGEQVYIRPIWSCLDMGVTADKGFVYFIWTPCQDGTQNVTNGNSHHYATVFNPDGTVEQFRSTSASGTKLKVIGGKLFSIRPHHWADQSVMTSDVVRDKVVAVWDGLEGPAFADIRGLVESDGALCYIGTKDYCPWPEKRTTVIVRHPDQILYEGRLEIWCRFSKTPDAKPVSSTVYGTGPYLLKTTDGSLVWGVQEDKVVTIYRDGQPILSGDFLGFYRDEEGVLTVIEALPEDGRNVHVL